MLSPWTRKLALATHVVSSLGWLGAVLAYLAIVTNVLRGRAPQELPAIWTTLELIGRYAIVPLALTALVSGLVMGSERRGASSVTTG